MNSYDYIIYNIQCIYTLNLFLFFLRYILVCSLDYIVYNIQYSIHLRLFILYISYKVGS